MVTAFNGAHATVTASPLVARPDTQTYPGDTQGQAWDSQVPRPQHLPPSLESQGKAARESTGPVGEAGVGGEFVFNLSQT